VFPLISRVEVHRQPVGVVGIIAPWNYPMTLAVSDALPALMAGNTVVLKPDSQTPLTALWVIDQLYQAGLPPRAFPVVLGPGSQLGPEIIARSDFVMFTGSTQVGRSVAAACGQRLIGASMELGGKNAMIVCADADVTRAAEVAARACFANSGQLCVSIERIYAVGEVYEQFLEAFVARLRDLRLGTGPGWGYDVGSLTGAKQLATVVAHVADAVGKGAQVRFGGRARPDLGPFVHEPTVLTGVAADMQCYEQETFGPVVSVYRVANPSEAVAAANESAYGLNASIITSDTGFGQDLAAKLRVGTVNINEGYATTWAAAAAPMGGMRASGLGRRHGDSGFNKYTEEQTVAVQRVLGFGAPFGLSDQRFGAALVAAIVGLKWVGKK
jgi:succinate-semialdehyde dehydrogenase/glutarate-semialdehyde dehydrogenase